LTITRVGFGFSVGEMDVGLFDAVDVSVSVGVSVGVFVSVAVSVGVAVAIGLNWVGTIDTGV